MGKKKSDLEGGSFYETMVVDCGFFTWAQDLLNRQKRGGVQLQGAT
jgi:hypothetical protein